jgi:hypothetical protein
VWATNKKVFYILLVITVTALSCSRGVWLSQNVYRPKKPKFSILKELFNLNSLIDDSSLYVSGKQQINYDENRIIGYMGFYNNGRMIIDNLYENELYKIDSRSSWETAAAIGYYTTNGNRIKVQYFISADGGQYITKEGTILKDTIILEDSFLQLSLKREIRYDTLIKSSYRLR